MPMDAQLNKIREILENHIGKENQISSGEIGPEIGIYEDATHVQVGVGIESGQEVSILR